MPRMHEESTAGSTPLANPRRGLGLRLGLGLGLRRGVGEILRVRAREDWKIWEGSVAAEVEKGGLSLGGAGEAGGAGGELLKSVDGRGGGDAAEDGDGAGFEAEGGVGVVEKTFAVRSGFDALEDGLNVRARSGGNVAFEEGLEVGANWGAEAGHLIGGFFADGEFLFLEFD